MYIYIMFHIIACWHLGFSSVTNCASNFGKGLLGFMFCPAASKYFTARAAAPKLENAVPIVIVPSDQSAALTEPAPI